MLLNRDWLLKIKKWSFSRRLNYPLPWNALEWEMCPGHSLLHATTKTGICYCKPGGIAYMDKQHSDCTGKSSWSDLSAGNTEKEPWGQPALITNCHWPQPQSRSSSGLSFYPDQHKGRKGNKPETVQNSKEWKHCTTSATEELYGLHSYRRSGVRGCY